MGKQKLRSEVDNKYKWNLSDIYKTIDEFNKDKEKVKELINKIEDFKGKLTENSDNLLKYLLLEEQIMVILTDLYIYSSCMYNEDVSNNENAKRYNEVASIDLILSEKSSFVMPELLKTDYNKIKEYINENDELKEFEYDLHEIYKYQKYVLSEKEEKMLSNLSDISSKFSDNFEVLTNSIIDYGIIKDENNEDVELTLGNYSKYIKSRNRRVRKETYESRGEALKKYNNLLSIDYEASIKSDVIEAKSRGYNSNLQMYLYPDDVTIDMYNNLLSVSKKHLDVLHKYYNLIKKVTKIDDLQVYDLSAPLTDNKDVYTPEMAKDIIVKGLSILGEDYVKVLSSSFDNGWIDFYPNKGKRSGYYETACFKTHPYVLGNFNDDFNSVSAICHELGHAMNSYYSNKSNKPHLSQYRIIVAEVASLTNEILLSNYIINNSTKKEEKLSAIENILSVFSSNFYGTLSEGSIFEKISHEKIFNGEILNADDFNKIYEDISNDYYGKDVIKSEYTKYNWSRVPHFYTPFYYYKYSVGISCACHIASKILSGDEEYKEKYLKFLSLGGSKSPIDELKTLDIDLEKEDVFVNAINYFDNLINKFEEIYNS